MEKTILQTWITSSDIEYVVTSIGNLTYSLLFTEHRNH
jgi:hypothetical protein